MPELEPGEEQQDYYRVLGLTQDASEEEIRHRYYTLAKKWHPDRFLNAPEGARQQAERRMKRLTHAYHVLGNSKLRLLYDERRALSAPPIDADAQPWQPTTGTRPFSPVPPGFAAPEPSVFREEDKNGVGLFFALMCFLLALGCIGLLLNGHPDILTGSFLILGALIFGLIGMLFLQQESFLSRAANSWMNSEPREFRQARAKAGQASTSEGAAIDDALSAFETLVEEALESIPAEFQEQVENLVVLVEPEPDEETLERVGVKEEHVLLGLYQGVSLTEYGRIRRHEPERITIFQHNIETYCRGDPDRIRDQVRRTVLHELAHHFGIGHEEMPIWVK
jgi:predicted Zn-dependent protease with MMP-like domain